MQQAAVVHSRSGLSASLAPARRLVRRYNVLERVKCYIALESRLTEELHLVALLRTIRLSQNTSLHITQAGSRRSLCVRASAGKGFGNKQQQQVCYVCRGLAAALGRMRACRGRSAASSAASAATALRACASM